MSQLPSNLPLQFTPAEAAAGMRLISLALDEDLADRGDMTTCTLVPAEQSATVQIVARQPGVIAGGPLIEPILRDVAARLSLPVSTELNIRQPDGSTVVRGSVVAELSGSLRGLLVAERTVLNFLTHLSGIAALTRQFVDRVAGTTAEILDTRKTHPGWRALEKYAVRAGGGRNHRHGLYDMALIKDNHLAGWLAADPGRSIADAVRLVRRSIPAGIAVEVEVDSLEQLQDALRGMPDIVLLDNMTCGQLQAAVAMRATLAPTVKLEASGGVTLATVTEIAATGVERISTGAITHSAPALDLAFDWKCGAAAKGEGGLLN